MSLKFILGNSGSGKTEYMYEQVVRLAEANPRQNFLVLVPEQFTMATQRKLVDLSTNQAIMNIDVLSFQRLAYRVFDEMGIQDLKVLEETGKNLVLRKIAQEQEEKLSVLKGNLHRMGYIREVKSLISELMQYNISPEELEEHLKAEKFSHVLQGKLSDVHMMYQGFLDYLQGKFITPEELLHVLIRLAPESAILKDAVLVLDEFTGFTPVQVELLRELMKICEEIWVSLTIDEKEDFFHSKGMQELFDMPKKTISTLMDLASQTHTEVLDPVVVSGGEKKRFLDAPELYFMEQNLFRSYYKRSLDEVESIQIHSLKTPKEELIWAARKINELVQEQGYRYRDIAVVSGNVETYGNYAPSVCGKYKIPYFLDTTKEVLFHPFIEFIRATLEVLEQDFSYHAIMRLLRTGYCGFSQEEIDKLENYLLATGIRGKKKWSSRWLLMPKNEKAYDLEGLEAIRQKFMTDFAPVLEGFFKENVPEFAKNPSGFGAKPRVETQIKALYTYIRDLEIEKQLWEKEKALLEAGEGAKSKEYGQIFGIVMDLFEKCVTLLGEETMSTEELGEILDSGFEAAKVAVIPASLDSVTIGDIERTRLNHIKVLLFLGVNEGIVPKANDRGGIISQYERELLEAEDINLAPGAREQAFIQKYYLYLNMTKPSQRLYLTYSRVDTEGKALRPSYLVRTILRMFPKLQVVEVEQLEKELNLSTEEAAKEYFLAYSPEELETGTKEEVSNWAEHHGETDVFAVEKTQNSRVWYALAKCFLESKDEKIKAQAKEVLDAFYQSYGHDPISHVVAEAIYGKNIEGSVTRLEKYAQCAYAHFLSYGLKLREREESGFESVDMGNLYHAAIENYSRILADSHYDWFTVPEETRDEFATRAMEEAVLAYPNLSIYATAENTHQASRMNYIFKQTLWALTTQVRKGKFVPKDFEVAFSKADHLDALSFELEQGNKINLRGRIDRMDTCVEDNQLFVKVIDYKSGSTKFDLLKIYRGMQLQLVVYMNAAMELEKKEHALKEVVPAGLLYYHIDDPVIEATETMTEADIKQAILEELKPDGLINQEEQVYRAMDEDFEKKSDVIPVEIKKDGQLSARSSVASTEEFATLSEYVKNSIIHTGNEIYGGNVEVAPYGDANNNSCEYCPYGSVCGFDKKIKGYDIRKGEKIEKKDILERMETENARVRGKREGY